MLSFTNMLQYEKKNIVVSLAAAIIFFCLKLSLNLFCSLMRKEKMYIFIFIFSNCNALYLYIFLFQQCKKTSRSAISNFIQNCVAWKHSLPGTLIISFVVGLDPDDEIFR